jgi:hypothetical protein
VKSELKVMCERGARLIQRQRSKACALISGTLMIVLIGVGCSANPNNTRQSVHYLPVQKEPGADLLTALLDGKIVLDDGYLRVQAEPHSYLIIWPYGFSWQDKDNEIWILNDKGRAVVEVGDSVTMGGGSIPQSFAEQKIGETLPAGVQGPFWLANPEMKAN